jgi:acetylornithine/LysW-gamma-L-lysine aminotransferase
MGQVLLCGGECEAVRAALQFAWHHTGRTQVVLAGNQHSWLDSPLFSRPEAYRYPAGLPVPVFESVPFNQLDRLASAISTVTAAVILPIVQTGDGVWPATAEYLRGVQRLCRERGALLVVDEIHTGFGVTGRRFACQHYDLQPDLLFTGTGMAAGLPLAALFVSQRLGELPPVAYSSTLYLDPVACAAGLAVLCFVQSNQLPRRAAALGQRLAKGLAGIASPLLEAVQSAGLLVTVKLKIGSRPYLIALAKRGILARPAGEHGIAFRPPLVISAEEVDTIIATMAQVLKPA